MLLPKRGGRADEYLFHKEQGVPISQTTYKQMLAQLMMHCGCAEWREVKPGASRPNDIGVSDKNISRSCWLSLLLHGGYSSCGG